MDEADDSSAIATLRDFLVRVRHSRWFGLVILTLIVVVVVWQISDRKHRLVLPRELKIFSVFVLIAFGFAAIDALRRWYRRRQLIKAGDIRGILGILSAPGPDTDPAEMQHYWNCLGIDSPWGEVGDPARRQMFLADAEDLAEGGVTEFLELIRPYLNRQGVELPRISDEHYSGDGYWLQLGDQRLVLWERQEASDSWELTAIRTFAVVNRLLDKAHSAERIYAVNGGEDLCAVFLTDSEFQTICGDWKIAKSDKPYRIDLQ